MLLQVCMCCKYVQAVLCHGMHACMLYTIACHAPYHACILYIIYSMPCIVQAIPRKRKAAAFGHEKVLTGQARLGGVVHESLYICM